MSIIDSINQARQSGSNDDAIMNEIAKQNPQKADSFSQARTKGANSTQILNGMIKQNTAPVAIDKVTGRPLDPVTKTVQKVVATIPAAVGRVATDVNQAGSDVYDAITGQGANANDNALTRGVT